MSKKSQTYMRVRMIVWIFAALLFAAESWARCTTDVGACYNLNYYKNSGCSGQTSESVGCLGGNCWESSTRKVICSGNYGTCTNAPNQTCNGIYYQSFTMDYCDVVECSTQCEADSVSCVNDGGTWAVNPNATCGKSCNTNACTAADTASLQEQVSKCDSLGGSNDFSLVNNGDNCALSGFCDLCNGTAYKKVQAALKKRCCELGFLPDSVTCAIADASSATKEFNLSSVECSPSKPEVKITASGETYRDGCDPEPGSSTSTGESSNSNDGSSSSECIGLDCPESSTSDLGDIVGELEDIKDSLHRIIIYDSTTASNTMDMVNYLYDIKTCLEAGTCGGGAPIDYSDSLHAIKDTLHHSNELLKQIAGKDVSVTVNGGLTAEKQAELVSNISYVADSAAKYGIVNGEKLDSIVSALHQLGADTVAHRLDSMRNGILQDVADSLATVGGWLAGFDSIFANWGDTTGGMAAGDTSGKGGELDALGDSLAGALWGYPCDTTGGKTCEEAYIGSNGLENAKTAWSGAADALGDSLQSGAVNDSVKSWTNKLINNGVLSGNGSATCPAVFNRTWQVPIGRGSSYTFGPFSTMVCHDFGMGLTFWALARILLRAMVAISCMWWLYRAVTGTDGGNNDED